ncbi:MAG: DinB family protein [Terriglobales bacterium]
MVPEYFLRQRATNHSVIVSAADFFALASNKPEYDSILPIYPDAVKACEIPFEFLQSIRGRYSQVLYRYARIQQIELLLYPAPKFLRQPAGSFGIASVENVGRCRVREADNHCLIIPEYRVIMYRHLEAIMAEASRIADELRRAFEGEAWHGDSLFEILREVTAAQASAHPLPNAHSIWELVLHIAAWDDAVRRRMTGIAAVLSNEENFPTVTDTTETAWQKALGNLRSTHEQVVAAVERFPEASLSKQVPGKQGAHYTFYFMLHGLAQHAAYHAGQIALLKKM